MDLPRHVCHTCATVGLQKAKYMIMGEDVWPTLKVHVGVYMYTHEYEAKKKKLLCCPHPTKIKKLGRSVGIFFFFFFFTYRERVEFSNIFFKVSKWGKLGRNAVKKLSCENIMLQSYHLVLQAMWILKFITANPSTTNLLELLAYTPINTIFIDILIVNVWLSLNFCILGCFFIHLNIISTGQAAQF